MEPQHKDKQRINWKTILAIFLLLVILFLDVLVIWGAYLGIKYVAEQVSDFFYEVSKKQKEKREKDFETAETTRDLKELLREEQEQLDKILGQDDK